jgi:flagellar protein FlaF
MANNPIGAYESVEKATLGGRSLEAHVLSLSAVMLADLRDHWDGPDRDARLDEVLRHNQKVWSFFQAEISHPDNPMPDEIKSNILALSVFIDKRTFEVMAYPEKEKLDILIAINRNLAAGLRGDAGDGVTAEQS